MLRKLRAKILKTGDHFLDKRAGELVTVKCISKCGQGGYQMVVETDGGATFRCVYLEHLEPLQEFLDMVPETHRGSSHLMKVWLFSEMKCDAWDRDQGPPKDLEAYEEKYGAPWKDIRTFDVARVGW